MRVQSLQVVRFVAALGVVQSHVALNYGLFGHNQFGAIGVDVFFVLSGYVVSLSARSHPDGFLANRFWRVFPPWWVAVAPWLLSAGLASQLDWRGVLASVALWPATDVFHLPYLSVGWSLCYEVAFYFALWLAIRGVKPWLLLLAYTIAVLGSFVTGWAVFKFLGSPMIVEFLFGVGLANLPPLSKRGGLAFLALGTAIIATHAVLGTHGLEHPILAGEPLAWARPFLWGLPAAAIVAGSIPFAKLSKWADPLVLMGDASYAIYLTHLTVMAYILVTWPKLSPGFLIPICLAVGLLMHLLVEKPLLKLRRARPTSSSLQSAH